VKAVRTKNRSRAAAATLAPKAAAGRSGDVASAPGWLRFAPVFIALAVAAVYATTVGFNFIGFDDREILKQHYFIIGDLSKIKLAFTTDAFLATNGSFYRPLQTVSFMLDAFVGGPKPFIYHLTNLLLHIASSLCVFWLLLTLGYQRRLSLLLALVFALHPMFVPMVAWVPTRGDLLLTIFFIVAFILFIKSLRANRPALVLWHGITFFLALLSKETAVAVPPLCLLYYYFEFRKTRARKLIKPYFAVWLVAGAVWYYLHSALHVVGDNSVGLTALIQNLRIMPELLGKFFVPVRFQLAPLFTFLDTAIGVIAAALLAWLIACMGAWTDRKVQVGLLWAILCILPVMIFRNSDAKYIFDYLYHRAYLPSIGLIIVLAELLKRLSLRNEKYFRPIAVGAALFLLYCGMAAFHELGFYRDAPTFFTEAIARTPRNALCYNNRGTYYGNELHDQEAALKDFNKAVELNPKYMVAIANRGVTRGTLGQKEEAIADLQRALAINPNSPNPDFILRIADLRYLLNDFIGSIADYNRLLAMDKMYPRIYSKRAGSEAMLGQSEEALRDADKALEVDPKDEEAYNSRGLANRLLGRLDEAANDFSLAILIKEDYSRPYNNRGTVYLAQGQPERAIEDFSKAIELDSHFADAYSNRGAVEHQLGRDEAALKDLDEALRLNPNFADAYQNRGVVKNVLKLFPEALADFDQALKLSAGKNNGAIYVGRGISKLYLGDNAGACEDWRTASVRGATNAAELIAEYCAKNAAGDKLKPKTQMRMRLRRSTGYDIFDPRCKEQKDVS
jgi:tetratricopeptide (TPR) repeat protein